MSDESSQSSKAFPYPGIATTADGAGTVTWVETHITQGACAYCTNPGRNSEVICVVETPYNVLNVEKTREFNGRYHVLHGALSPLQGIGPEQLRLKNLFERLKAGQVKEIIVATNPNVEGEATAIYLSKLIKPLGIRVTRIAMGIPVGSELEFADEVTMLKALEGRREI